jgi:hypothetical protein
LSVPVALFLAAVTAAALASGPLGVLARPIGGPVGIAERPRALTWLLIYGATALLAALPLFLIYHFRFIVPFGVAAAGFLLLRVWLVRGRADRTLAGELIGTAGLSLVGPAAHAVAVGAVQPIGALLWVLLFLFFASGVFYVRMRIRGMLLRRQGHAPGGRVAVRSCLLYHAALLVGGPLLAVSGVVPWMLLLAFAPALWRAAVGFRRQDAPLNLKRLGWSEVAQTLAFVLVLVAVFRLSPPLG